MNAFTKISSSKSFRYGSVAMAFTVIFVALVVVLNVITTAIHVNRPLMVDMTKEQIYGITDNSRNLLKDTTEPVRIIFFMDLDQYEKTDSACQMILQCAKTYAAEFSNVTIEVKDSIKNPSAVNKYKSSEVSNIARTSVVVETQYLYRVLTRDSFFVISESTGNPFGFKGEVQFTSAILQVTSRDDMPVVYFTTGHSEGYSKEYGEFISLIESSGYTTKQIDLSLEEIDPTVKLMVILDPVKDFIGTTDPNSTTKSEIDKLADFLNNYGNLMYFTDPTRPAFPELEQLLGEYGIAFDHGSVVLDYKNAVSDPTGVLAQYNVTNTAADELHANIRKLSSLPKTVMYYAKPILLPWGGEAHDITKTVAALTSYPTAQVASQDGKTQPAATANLMALAQRTRTINNEPKSTFVLACGSRYFLNQQFLASSFANSDVLKNAIRIMGTRKVPVDLDFKVFDDNKITISTEEANNWTLAVSLALPILVLATAVVVFLRRRHS